MHISSYFNTYKNLVLLDLQVFKQTVLDKVIDLTIWVVLTTVVTGYIMPFFGLSQDFGPFQFGGIIAAVGLFELYSSAVDLVADFQGNKVINYALTLPIPSWLALLAKSTYYFIVYATLTTLMLPIGKLSLWNTLNVSQIVWIKLALALIMQCIFYACFVLWAASIIKNMSKLGSIWARYIFPMWFMGGFQFSWLALYKVIPVAAYINLINPMIYITESTRAAMLGQEGYINYWICVAVIAVCAFGCFMIAFRNLKKRLDFV
jgi:ABC-type polysaccharide/polyol phosphate export permease